MAVPPPFWRDTFAAAAYRILHGEPDLGDLPEPLRGIVARCLAKEPERRPSARSVLLELLGEPPDAPPTAQVASGAAGRRPPAPGIDSDSATARIAASGGAPSPATGSEPPVIRPDPTGRRSRSRWRARSR
ncbi:MULTISPECIES: hypothetical protein [unclassified Nonomuraea]|uniref:hypothetical protein n=1 Tax=unclassified Nonomuraea TaxID=2593643 RepID=UPI0035BF3CA8